MEKISEEQMNYLEKLSMLRLAPEERETIREGLTQLLDCAKQLGELDTDSVEPLTSLFPENNVLREDVAVQEYDRKDMVSNAPEGREGVFVVPRAVAPDGKGEWK